MTTELNHNWELTKEQHSLFCLLNEITGHYFSKEECDKIIACINFKSPFEPEEPVKGIDLEGLEKALVFARDNIKKLNEENKDLHETNRKYLLMGKNYLNKRRR